MDKNQILELLKTIKKLPGFNRDIVSFGMVKNVELNNEDVQIYLNISSQNDEKKQLIKNSIESLLSSKLKSLKMNLSEDKTPPIHIATMLIFQTRLRRCKKYYPLSSRVVSRRRRKVDELRYKSSVRY